MTRTLTGSTAPEPNWLALLPVARELECWVSALPAISVRSLELAGQPAETWETFLRRQRRSEAELGARLRRLPGCTLTRSPQGLRTGLYLAGVEVTSHDGVLGACRQWIATGREEALRSAQRAG